MITEEELTQHKWKKRILNGIIPEYYQPLAKEKMYGLPKYRIVVRFNEYKDRPGARVFLDCSNFSLRLARVNTYAQLATLVEVLAGAIGGKP